MSLPLTNHTQFGLFLHAADPAGIREAVALCERVGFQSLWQGDHISFGPPIQDPFSQLAYAAALSDIRHFIADFVGPETEANANAERFMTEVVPLLE
jgi:alkanesulfonate monooxygenase SsuD/methylene tetrahydromethanopterin reductase-like flavin-dependent oxidoreductase (luciferase family)